MVPIEPQRTHIMSFDGFCDVFSNLSAEIIVGEIEDLEGVDEENYTAIVEQVEQDDR